MDVFSPHFITLFWAHCLSLFYVIISQSLCKMRLKRSRGLHITRLLSIEIPMQYDYPQHRFDNLDIILSRSRTSRLIVFCSW
jgi:hypothetical protein